MLEVKINNLLQFCSFRDDSAVVYFIYFILLVVYFILSQKDLLEVKVNWLKLTFSFMMVRDNITFLLCLPPDDFTCSEEGFLQRPQAARNSSVKLRTRKLRCCSGFSL